jgi:glucan phosphoethanolaminetransferase (alkaline phosphatase superfamily)
MDLVLDSIINRMEDRCAIVIYLSDHGESLGEDGYWLHAAGAETTKHPACVVWYSDSFAAKYPNKVEALLSNKSNRYRTDFLFHSVLAAAGLSVIDSDSTLDIFQKNIH